MVDVKTYQCFPTTICEFKLEPNNLMLDYVKNSVKNHKIHTEDNLHKTSEFNSLKEKVLETSEWILKEQEYEYEKLDITGMWANILNDGEVHAPHTHSNNFLSGVYYLQATEDTSPIHFFDPRPQAHILSPRKKLNWNNSSMVQFNSVTGIGLIFPSWLQHWVPKNNGVQRISVSWNIMVRGNYGEPNTLQNAYI